jgi:hypothetical protein
VSRSARHAVNSLVLACCWLAVTASAALAENGVGFAGRTTDKMVTYWGLALVIFFPLLIALLSYLQGRLDRAKADRKRGLARFSQQ